MPKKRAVYSDSKAAAIYRDKKVYRLPNSKVCSKYDVSIATIWNWCRVVEATKSLSALALKSGPIDPDAVRDSYPGRKKELVIAYLAGHPDATWETCKKDLNLEISWSWFYRVSQQVLKPPTEVSSVKSDPPKESLEDINQFLRWWNIGERRGFVARLLKELKLLDLT